MPISYRRFTWPAVLAYGFRPFFLLSAIWALLAVPAWLFVLLNATGAATTLPPHAWHAHELLYGFIGAAVAGFLLTVAVPSFQTVVADQRSTASINELVEAMVLARSEAIKRGENVTVCASSTGADTGAISSA